MHQIIPERVATAVRFFPEWLPNRPMLEAFFEGRALGRAFVNDYRAPQACAVAMNFSFLFFGGEVSARFFETVVRRLRREQALHVVWPSTRGRRPAVPAADEVVRRIEFRERRGVGRARLSALQRVTDGGEIRRIDRAVFERCYWRDEIVRAIGSADEFLRHGIGVCLMRDGAVVAEAYGCFWGSERVELAAVTRPEFRGRGFAPAVCAALIEIFEDLGFQPYWSCDAKNAPSLRVAAKLGFEDPRSYRLLRYQRFPAPLAI